MSTRYKIILSNKNLYKEIELKPEYESLTIGTGTECDVRLYREMFFSPIELTLYNDADSWSIVCADNLYISLGDIKKLITKKLSHGDEFTIKYQETNNDVFSLSFMIDFDYDKKDYNLEIDLNMKDKITIGSSSDCNIEIKNNKFAPIALTLKKESDNLKLLDNGSQYGAFVNGIKFIKEKQIKDFDFFSIGSCSFYYKQGKLYTSADDEIIIHGLNHKILNHHSTHFDYPRFNRNPRIKYIIPNDDLEIQQPPQKPTRPKKNIIMSLIPSIVMLAMTVVLRGIIGGGGTFIIYSAVSMSMGIIMSIVSFIQEKKAYDSEYKERIEEYHKYLAEKENAIQKSRNHELSIRNEIFKSLTTNLEEVEEFGDALFERQPQDEDFLKVYLGVGRIESNNPVKYTKQEFVDLSDPLVNLPEDIVNKYRYIENASIVSDFNTSNSVGIVGEKQKLKEFIKNITLDLSIRHFYNEVKMVYILDNEFISKLSWIRWLHNVENKRLNINNIACDEESKNIVLEDLYLTLSEREMIYSADKQMSFDERYIVFVTNNDSIRTHPVSKYFKDSSKYGFTFVFLEEHEEFLPQYCSEIITLLNNNKGTIVKTENGEVKLEFTYNNVADEVASDVAIKLGAVRVDEVTLEGELTKNISMFEMLDILSVDDINLAKNWKKAEVYKSLAAPLGVKRKNEIVYLDISDKGNAHGPHGLVAGTTGSGKSEVLQTYILSMASLYHPYEVGFVIIDFKGGGMANQFKDLPHLIGTITNIDGREINRSLLSIKAELVKRQELFAENSVNHINDYIRLYKAGRVTNPLPHLIMIVDEFAELKAEHPDFMKELISAARIGRTLGIHLILATQKPAGVVDAQIWSNSKFKLCLKVQTKEDSNEVLKTPLAAEIVEPGRAYFQVGNNEIFELFQSAYSGANIPDGNDNEFIYEINECNLWGKRTLKYTNKKQNKNKESITQLQAIVNYIHDYCNSSNIAKLPGICLPSLKDRIITDEVNYLQNAEDGIVVPIGVYDDPEQQEQGYVNIDVSRNNVYIVGSPQSGKTVMLQTMIYGLIHKYTPEQVNLYLIDCGSMVLKIFEESAHVGGVVLSNEEEKCKNLFKLLHTFIVQRKKHLSSKGIGSYSSYLEAGNTDMPMIVVAIDNFAAFKEYFPVQFEEVNSLTREGQSVGIAFVITSPTTNAMNYRTQANFGKKFILNCNDENEYSNLLGHCKQTPKEVPGRGLMLSEKRILEFQVAMFGRDKKEANRSQELINYINARNLDCSTKAVKIPMIPERLVLHDVMNENVLAFRNSGVLPIGMDYQTVDLASINLNANGSLSLLGDVDSKERFVSIFVKQISHTAIFHNIEMVIVDDKNSRLKEYERFGFVKEYENNVNFAQQVIAEFCDDALHRGENDSDSAYRILLLNNSEVFKKVCTDKAESKRTAELIKSATERGVFILFANVDNQAVGFNSSEVLKAIKEERSAILFAQLNESKMFDVSGRPKVDTSFDNTNGYYFNGSTYSKIKIFE